MIREPTMLRRRLRPAERMPGNAGVGNGAGWAGCQGSAAVRGSRHRHAARPTGKTVGRAPWRPARRPARRPMRNADAPPRRVPGNADDTTWSTFAPWAGELAIVACAILAPAQALTTGA